MGFNKVPSYDDTEENPEILSAIKMSIIKQINEKYPDLVRSSWRQRRNKMNADINVWMRNLDYDIEMFCKGA